MTMIPAAIFVEIPEESLPAGPQGLSAYQIWLNNGHQGTEADFLDWLRNGQIATGCVREINTSSIAPGANTASISYATTGLACSIDTLPGETVLIDVRGMCNHTAGQQIVHFTLKRDGIELTPANHTGLACARIDIVDGCRALDFQHHDQPDAGTHTYELFWRNTNAGAAYLGRRLSDTVMMVPTTMMLMAYT